MPFTRRPASRPAPNSIPPKWHKTSPRIAPYTACGVVTSPTWDQADTLPPHQIACYKCFGRNFTS